MQSEITAQITEQNVGSLALKICRQPCAGCDGRCGAFTLGYDESQSISVSTPYIQYSPEKFEVGNQVKVGVPVKTLISLSLLVYLVPLVLMLSSAVACFLVYSQTDGAIAISAFFGLCSGLFITRFLLIIHERHQASDTLCIRHISNGA